MRSVILFIFAICVLHLQVQGKFFPFDLAGEFVEFDVENPASCPKLITHTTFYKGPMAMSWGFEHSTVLHGESRCDSKMKDRMTVFYNDKLLPDSVPEALNDMLIKHGINQEVIYPLNNKSLTRGETYYIGYEDSGRYCQDGSKFDSGTVYFMFRPFPPVNMPIIGKVHRFKPGYKYMVVVPKYSDEVCVYKSEIESPEVSPDIEDELEMMSPEPSMELDM